MFVREKNHTVLLLTQCHAGHCQQFVFEIGIARGNVPVKEESFPMHSPLLNEAVIRRREAREILEEDLYLYSELRTIELAEPASLPYGKRTKNAKKIGVSKREKPYALDHGSGSPAGSQHERVHRRHGPSLCRGSARHCGE